MEDSKENLYVKLFCIIGIIAFSLLILWLGYKFYPIIKRIIFGAKKPLNETHDAEDEISTRDEMTQTDPNPVVFRKHRKFRSHKGSDTGNNS